MTTTHSITPIQLAPDHDPEVPKEERHIQIDAAIQPTWAELIEWRLTDRPNSVPEQLVNTVVTSNVTVSAGTVHQVQSNHPQTD